MRNKKKALPGAYAAMTKDTRFAGTYEVLIPVPDRVKPYRVPLQFESLENAETWIHSPDGEDMIREVLEGAKK